jgi:4-hydroxybenzoyl-CoA thioesterase
MFVSLLEVHIEFGDCDPAGIVFYPNYFRYFDAATARMLQNATGLKKADLIRKYGIAGIPMVDTGANFKKPCRFGDVVTIESRVIEFGRSSFKVEHRLLHEGDLAVEAHEKRVWVERDPDDPEQIRPKAIPDEVKRALE